MTDTPLPGMAPPTAVEYLKRLTKIPDTRKKRDVVLRWLATRFETGRRYPEREVNALIRRRHEDAATLRRGRVGAGLMARAAGVYWRTP